MSSLLIRLAHEGDNEQLLNLARECPVQGPIRFYQEREPRFFTLSELLGDSCRIYVVESEGKIVGSISCALRWIYLNGTEIPTWYFGDLKIAPGMRGRGILREFLTQASRLLEEGGRKTDLGLSVIVKTNPALKVFTSDKPYMPRFVSLGTIRNYAIHLLFSKRIRDSYQVTRATGQDLEAMTDLLRKVSVQKQFAPVIDPAGFWKWVEQAPGLGIHNFYLARKNGRILGLVGVWDQQSFKKIRVLSYSPKIRCYRILYNSIARLFGAPAVPPPGWPLPYFYLTHLAIPGDDPAVFHALLTRIHNDHLHGPYSFFTVGLRAGSHLEEAMRGFFYHTFEAQGFALIPRGSPLQSFDFHSRPLYVDTALT